MDGHSRYGSIHIYIEFQCHITAQKLIGTEIQGTTVLTMLLGISLECLLFLNSKFNFPD